MIKKTYIFSLILLSISANIFGADKSTKEIKGDKYYFIYSFEKAIDYYTHAKNLSIEGQRRLAESYRNINKPVLSEEAYLKLVTTSGGDLPDDIYNYAMILKSNGKYDQSNKWMDKLCTKYPSDLRGNDYMLHNGDLAYLLSDNGKYKITTLDVNTEAQDFGATYYKDKIVFSSSRATHKMISRKYNWTGDPFLDVYVSDVENGQLEKPKIFDCGINGKLHDGPVSFNKDFTYMAFSKNNTKDKSTDKVVEVQIYFSKYENDKWTKAQPFILNDKGYSVGHPCLTPDGNTMYFVSDMPGGFGSADIYRVSMNENGVWGKPENLGDKVNTEGDEMFPFYEKNSDILFFSSNGRYGIGGMDIFICEIQGTNFGKVYNAGSPLNSRYDDFSIATDSKLSKGYFSSNRNSGQGGDDIYSIDFLIPLIGKKITGIAKDKNENALNITLVTLFDEYNNIIDTLTTKSDGAYIFYVDSDKNYKLNGKKVYYSDGNTTVNTFGKDLIIIKDITLIQKEVVIEQPFIPSGDLAKIPDFNLNKIYFDYDKYGIRADARIELDKIVKIMNQYPDMIIELGSHTDCRADDAYNQILSDKRAISSVDYIKTKITNPERISGKGYGKTQVINGCDCDGEILSPCNEVEHQKNRRTEFIVIRK